MRNNKIAITTGDPLGIGEEVTYKALNILKPDKKDIIIIGKDLNLGYETIEVDCDDIGKYCYDCLKIASNLALSKEIKGIVHTHSVNAVAFAQAGMAIPALGTTHADYFYGDIPCTRELTKQEVMEDYETNTGKVIIETVDSGGYDPMAIPGIVVKNHGPFAWGKSPANAVYNAVVMEKVAEMDLKTLQLNPNSVMAQYVLDKHYMRKHGPNAYYGPK